MIIIAFVVLLWAFELCFTHASTNHCLISVVTLRADKLYKRRLISAASLRRQDLYGSKLKYQHKTSSNISHVA